MIDRCTGASPRCGTRCARTGHRADRARTCPASDSAIWGRDGAVIEPGTGRILVATGNAPFNGSTDWGDSVLELRPDAQGPAAQLDPDQPGAAELERPRPGEHVTGRAAGLSRPPAGRAGRQGRRDRPARSRSAQRYDAAGRRSSGRADPGDADAGRRPSVHRARHLVARPVGSGCSSATARALRPTC